MVNEDAKFPKEFGLLFLTKEIGSITSEPFLRRKEDTEFRKKFVNLPWGKEIGPMTYKQFVSEAKLKLGLLAGIGVLVIIVVFVVLSWFNAEELFPSYILSPLMASVAFIISLIVTITAIYNTLSLPFVTLFLNYRLIMFVGDGEHGIVHITNVGNPILIRSVTLHFVEIEESLRKNRLSNIYQITISIKPVFLRTGETFSLDEEWIRDSVKQYMEMDIRFREIRERSEDLFTFISVSDLDKGEKIEKNFLLPQRHRELAFSGFMRASKLIHHVEKNEPITVTVMRMEELPRGMYLMEPRFPPIRMPTRTEELLHKILNELRKLSRSRLPRGRTRRKITGPR